MDARVRISVLDGFRMSSATETLDISPGGQRLVAFLALRDRAVRRRAAAGTLWPDATESRANASLRAALARVPPAATGAVESRSVELCLADGVSVDLRAGRELAHSLVAPSGQPVRPETARSALATLSAELLPGWYDDWVLLEAESWRQLRLHALEALAASLAAAGHFAPAIAAALAAIAADPLRESSHAALIRVHLAEGNRSEAVRAFEACRRLLEAELHVAPAPMLTDLVAGLRV